MDDLLTGGGMPPEREAIPVSALNEYVKGLLETDALLCDVTVKGEISNFKAHQSGHLYFSLKDEGGVLRSVMFRGSAQKLRFRPEDGMKVLAHGRISAFVRDGQYQLYCDGMQPDGIGSLAVAYEQLKRKLAAEGLFSEARKKPLPKIPTKIGVITSDTGAAVRDIINILGRRFPYAQMLLYPALVQGADAAPSLIAGMEYFIRSRRADVIIIGRGGGSIEDLWAFNDERLARVIASSPIPVISAVGHETDFTICDFVADKRAPTPSAAAELAVPDTGELMQRIGNVVTHMKTKLDARLTVEKRRLEALSTRPVLTRPERYLDERRMELDGVYERLVRAAERVQKEKQANFSVLTAKLGAMSPLSVLTRGYCMTTDEQGKVVKSARTLSPGDGVRVRFGDGTADCRVEKIEKREESDR